MLSNQFGASCLVARYSDKVNLLAIVVLVLLIAIPWQQAWGCDSCQQQFIHELENGTAESKHSKELLNLMRASRGQRADNSILSEDQSIETARQPAGELLPASVSPELPAVRAIKGSSAQLPSPVSGPVSSANARPGQKIDIANLQPYAKGEGKLPPTSFVPPGTKPDKKVTITMEEGEVSIGNGVIYKGFNIDGKIPGPTIIVDEGDVVEFTAINKGTVPHGVSIHAAYTQTSKHLGKIGAGETKSMLFRASYPGVYMYHCAPGGHAIPIHVLLGQYGMMVVRPKNQTFRMEQILNKKPDVEMFLLQHELYASGKDAVEGNALYTMFNGKLFRHVSEPVNAKPGDFVRINFLNVGPNLVSTFHIVGIVWDFVYWQGLPNPENTFVGGQSVVAGPSDSWTMDFRAPEDEGAYLMLTHAVGSASRGAIGILNVSKEAERTPKILADGPSFDAKEMAELKKNAIRVLSPTEPSPDELRNPWKLPLGQDRARVQIIGNSYYPKVIEVPVGTTVEWTNEDVFTFFEGEFSGIHNVLAYQGPETFASPMLAHAERFEHKFTKVGEYSYMCTPHPYMRGVVRVVDKK